MKNYLWAKPVCCVAILFLMLSRIASAQSSANYVFTTNTQSSLAKDLNGNPVDMSAGTSQLLGSGLDANVSPVVNIGFTFFLMGKPFTQFALQDDGIIQLGGTRPIENTYTISGGTTTVPQLSGFCADMRTGLNTGKVHYKLNGTAPNRVVVIEFVEMQLFYIGTATQGTSTYQVRLYENGTIEYVYGTMSATDITTGSRNPSIGFYTGSATGQFAMVSYATHTVATSGTYTPNAAPLVTGPIAELTSSNDSTRRAYVFTPRAKPVTPTNLIFGSVTGSSMALNWTDNATTESGYQLFRSDDNGVSYNSVTVLPTNTITYTATGLMPSRTYGWKVVAFSEAGISDTLSGNYATINASLVRSTRAGGNWSDPGTWMGGVLPSAYDSALIADSATVTINTDTAVCYTLRVGEGRSGVLTYAISPAATLTVTNNVYIDSNASFNAGTGTLTSHNLKIGGSTPTDPTEGSLKVNGVFDMQTTAGVTVWFMGSGNAKIEGNPAVLNFRPVFVNKGTSSTNRPVLEILTGFTVQGANTVGLIAALSAGVVRISGTFTQSNPLLTGTSYTIPLNGGFHLNNPNFTVTSLNGISGNNGLLQVSKGTYYIGQTAAQTFNLGTGSEFTVDGGSVVAAAGILATNTMTFNFSSGTIYVARAGNSVSSSPSFGINSSGSKVNWTGGKLYLEQKSTGVSQLDYLVAPAINGSGGILQVGNSATAANAIFNVRGNVPNLVIDSSKTANLAAQLNISGNVTVSPGSVLKLNNFGLVHSGNSVVNNGFIDGRTSAATWTMSSSVSGHSHSGSGTDTIQMLIVNDTNMVTLNKPVVLYGLAFLNRAGIINSRNITLGNGLSQTITVQLGTSGYTAGNVGMLDTVPVFNLGTGLYNLSYQQEGAARTMGFEIPTSRIINNLVMNNSSGVVLAGGGLELKGVLTLTLGRLTTTVINVLKITNTSTAATSTGTTSSYIDGPLQRRLPVSSRLLVSYPFPIGKDTAYNRANILNAGINAGGTVDVMIESFNGTPTGSADHLTMDTLLQKYWQVRIPAGKANLDSAYITLYRNDLTVLNKIAYSDSVSGIFRRMSNAQTSQGIITTNKLIGGNSVEGVFAIGEYTNGISGSFLIGANKVAPNYKTLTAAMADLAERKVVGNLELLLDADYSSALETFPILLNSFISDNPAYTITIRPKAGVSASIIGNQASTLIRFSNGLKNYVFDGSNNGTNSQNLFIQNTNTSGGAAIIFQGTALNQGVRNTSLKNTIIKGGSNASSYGVIVGANLSLSSNGIGHESILIQNNTIYNCLFAFVLGGSATDRVKKITVSRNTIGTDTAAFYNKRYGIFTTYVDSVVIDHNTVKNIKTNVSGALAVGVFLSNNSSNSMLNGNIISGLESSGASGSAYGISIGSNAGVENIQIFNNVISSIHTSNNGVAVNSAYIPAGIRLDGGNNVKLYFNTVHLWGAPPAGTAISYSTALFISQGTAMSGLDIRNNIFSNSITGVNTSSKQYTLVSNGFQSGAIFDYNNFTSYGVQGSMMYNITTSRDTNSLDGLKAITANNAHSVSASAQFVNDSSLAVGVGPLAGTGQMISGISVDIDDSLRSDPPTPGAYERKRDIAGAVISYALLSKQVKDTIRTLTGFATIADFSGVDTVLAKPRIYFRKSTDANVFGQYPANNNASFNGWKYVEATNTGSPFSFTINYALLTSGTVSLWDTILYFVAARDIVSNLSANPSDGFKAIRIDSVISAPLTLNRYVIYEAPLSGTYKVGANNTAPNFATINAAVSALHIRGVSGPVVLRLTDSLYSTQTETFPVAINAIEGSSPINTITLRPDSAKKVALIGAAALPALITLNGTGNFIIDGSNNGTMSQDLFFQNTNTTAGAAIAFQGTAQNGGSQNCIVRNTIIKGVGIITSSFGIYIAGPNLTSAGVGHANLLIRNNTIYNCDMALGVSGSSTSRLKNIVISGNQIGTDSAQFYNRRYGINLNGVDSITVINNTISNVKNTNAGIVNAGIYILNQVTNSVINGNRIKGIYSTSGSGTSAGIYITGSTGVDNIRISNNTINDLQTANSSSSPLGANPYGIRIFSGNNLKIYFNTIHLSGSPVTGTGLSYSAALCITPGAITGLDIRNNIFSNSITGVNAASKHYALVSTGTMTGTIFDYNNFVTNSPQGILMYQNATTPNDISTLADLRSATGGNANSVNIDPQFLNDSNLTIGYGVLTGLATAATGVSLDIDDSVRSNPPTPGAYERKKDIVGPVINYNPLSKNSERITRVLSGFAGISDYSKVDTVSAKPRIYFRKSTDADVFGTYPANNNAAFNGWKYVEATNTSSPFGFAIDYTLLTSGGVALWDTIVYFVVAQDAVANLTANPIKGFAAKRIDSVITAPLVPNRYVIYDTPLSGNYLVGKNNTSPNFSSITAAASAIQIRGVSGPVVLKLTDSLYSSDSETFPVTFNTIEGTSATNTVTIRPDSAKKVSIIGASSSGLLNFNGTGYVIVDGSNNGTSGRDLFIQNTTLGSAGVMFQGTTTNQGTKNCTLKNTIIKGGSNASSFGVTAGGGGISPGLSSPGVGHRNLLIRNNLIYNCMAAIASSGTSSTVKVTGVTITGNELGTDSAAFYNTRYGIYLTYNDSAIISKNTIKNIKPVVASNITGINIINATTNTVISGNTINGIYTVITAGYTALGISIESSPTACDNITIHSNSISDIRSSYSSTAFNGSSGAGIRIANGTNIRLYFNSVHLSGTALGTGQSFAAALSIVSSAITGLDIRNNIFSSTMTGTNTASRYLAMSFMTPFPTSVFDNNDFFAGNTQGILMATSNGSTVTYKTTLNDIQTATSANVNSVNIHPQFLNDSLLIPTLGSVQGLGVSIAGITTDIRDSIRAATPAIGAYEKGVDALAPAISYQALDKTTSLTNRSFSATITDYSGIDTNISKPRVYYRKSTDANVFGNYPADNNASFNGWKYTEATNTISPFNFTIDYSKLTSGGVSIWETIVYFVVAQDKILPPNTGSNPVAGFIASGVNAITTAPTIPGQYTIYDTPLAGTYNIGASYTYPNFNTITAAVDAMSQRGVGAPVILQLQDSNYTITPFIIREIEGASLLNTITLKPASGKKVVIKGDGSSSTGLIILNGTDHFRIDGSNNGTNSRDLFIQNTATTGAVILVSGTTQNMGSQNSVLRNMIIKGGANYGSTGILVQGTSAGPSIPGTYNNLVIENNNVYNCFYGISVAGTSASSKVKSVSVINNIMGTDTLTLCNTVNGIVIANVDSVLISRNLVKNQINANAGSINGINIGANTSNSIISSNTITGIYNQVSGSFGTSGINIVNGTGVDGISIVNNVISDLIANNSISSATSSNASGIRITAGSNIRVYHNTVHLFGQASYAYFANGSAALTLATSSMTGLDIRNNIFSNSLTSSTTLKQYALMCPTPYSSAIFDYNDFIANSSQGILMRGYVGSVGTDYTTLAQLKTATAANANSVSIDPYFASNTNLIPNPGTVESLGTGIPSVSRDILDSLRSNIPALGAYEKLTDTRGPVITYTILKNAVISTNRVLTNFATITDYSGINTTTAKPRLYFKKISDTSAFGNYPANNNASFNGWKYVEATNTTSPFSFTINYALLRGGSAGLWDTIQYFVAATDNLDSTHVTANPSEGFVASVLNKVTSAPTLLNQYIVIDTPLAGNYIVGATQVYPNFKTIGNAARALNLSGVSAPVTIQLADVLYSDATETFPVTFSEITGSSVLNTVTLKPASGKKVSIIGSSATGMINLNGTDNFIVDGSNNGTTTRDLFLQNNTSSGGAVFMFQGNQDSLGSQNCVLKNSILRGGNTDYYYGTFGLVIGGQTPGLTGGGGHSNLTIQNNMIYRCGDAVVISGIATSKARNITLAGNIIGSDSASLGVGEIGLYITNADSLSAINNTLQNIRGNNIDNIGIYIPGNTTNSIFSRNTIKGITGYPNFSEYYDEYGTCGIKLTGTGNNNIEFNNNAIADITNVEFWSTIGNRLRVSGIKIQQGNNIRLYFNSVHLSGELIRGSGASLYIDPAGATNLDIRNNIFSNTLNRTYSEPGTSYALCMYVSGSSANALFDYNNFTVGGNNGALMAIKNGMGLSDISTLAALKSSTAANVHSVSSDPLFASNTNLIPGRGTMAGLGTLIAGITRDIADSVRSNPPAIGAFEKEADITGPAISYSVLDNVKTTANRVLDGFAFITDPSRVDTLVKPRMYYRKSTNANVFGNYPANNNASFNGWKYAEASNSVSPFSFTIDYSKLAGGIAELDSVLYFIVAQDTLKNISANPGNGFAAVRLDSVLKAPANVNSYNIEYIPLAGNYLVGAGQTAPNYTTITAAVNSLHLRGVSGPVTFQLTSATYTSPAETFPITINEIVGTTDSNTVTFKPAAGNNVTITGSYGASALIIFNGTDHIIFDGSNNGTSSQNLFIRNTSVNGYGVWFQGDYINLGAQFSTFKNIKIRGGGNSNSYGIIIGGTTSVYSWGGSMLGGIGKGGQGHDGLLIKNNTVYNCVDALVISGISDWQTVNSVNIIGNSFGTDSTAYPNTKNGIYMQFCNGINIHKNTIMNVKNTSTVFNTTGINVKDYSVNCAITNNVIKGIYATNIIGMGAYGIDMDAPGIFNIVISNNTIGDIITSNYSVSATNLKNAFGIKAGAVSSLKLYFNTVHLYGQPTIGNNPSSSAALLLLYTNDIDIRNNIFSNSMTGKVAGSKHYALTVLNVPYGIFDYNDFIANSAHGVLMYDSTTMGSITTLAGLQAATFANAHSVNINPLFVSNTNLSLSANTLQGRGVMDSSFIYVWNIPYDYTKDIVDSARSALPTIGAYESKNMTTPVTLVSFEARAQGNDVDLSWTTASEVNNRGFEIERSEDGRNFEKVNFVNGKGNSVRVMRYRSTDADAFVKSAVLYYRLKQVDFDGTYAYSPVVKVSKESRAVQQIAAFPNPFSGGYTLSFATPVTGQASIEMMDMQGQVVMSKAAEVIPGSNTIEIPEAGDLRAGVYMVRLIVNGEANMIKVVKN